MANGRGSAISSARGSSAEAGRSTAPLAFFWGDDSYGVEAAVQAFRGDERRFPAGSPELVRAAADRGDPGRLVGEIHERLATGSMFGSGTVLVVSGAAALVRRVRDRDELLATLDLIAPGNGLVVAEETESGRKEPPGKALHDAIRERGGDVRRFDAPREGALAAWIETRARERAISLEPGAARELATRIGGFVREGDAERRHQGRHAVLELEKLALRQPDGGAISVDDVRALVAEAVPGTIWGFVDAVALRQRARSLELLERLLATTPAPVLLAVLHRRLRELIEVQDRLERGEAPGSLVRSMRLQPFRAETLARQARAWTGPELDAALVGLLELDAQVKGVGGRASSDARDRLAFDLWITDRVAPR